MNKKNTINYTAGLLSLGVLFLIFIFYFDKKVMVWARFLDNSTSPVHILLKFIDPVIDFISNGFILLLLAIVFSIAGKLSPTKRREVVWLLIGGFIFSGITAQILKYLAG